MGELKIVWTERIETAREYVSKNEEGTPEELLSTALMLAQDQSHVDAEVDIESVTLDGVEVVSPE